MLLQLPLLIQLMFIIKCEQRLPHVTSLSKQLQLPKRHMQEPRFYFETGAAGSTGVSILPGAVFRVPFTFKSNTPGFFAVCFDCCV